jgi:hypothetical protein
LTWKKSESPYLRPNYLAIARDQAKSLCESGGVAKQTVSEIVEGALFQIYSSEIDKVKDQFGLDRILLEMCWVLDVNTPTYDKMEPEAQFRELGHANSWALEDEPVVPVTDTYMQTVEINYVPVFEQA